MKPTVKYEIVLAIPELDLILNTKDICVNSINRIWNSFAIEYYQKNNVLISAVSIPGTALCNKDLECISNLSSKGKEVVVFHCTMNPESVKKLDLYEQGIIWIGKKLRDYYKQGTITITRTTVSTCNLTIEDEEK